MNKEEKLQILNKTSEQINKDYGKGSIMTLSDKPITSENVISTGSINLDIALGIGGLPKARVVEIYGTESSGKTTIATHVIAEAQKLNYTAAIVDAEHAFDREYATKIGVNVDELYISQPDYGEQALAITEQLIDSKAMDVIVVDSVAALVPQGEFEGEMGESKMGLQARMMGQALRKLTSKIAKNDVLVIFINQLRDKIGVMFGNPETTSGGNALKFYASIRLDVRRATPKIVDGIEPNSNRVTVKVVKNKVAPPFRKAEFDIIFGEGIDKLGEVVDWAVELEIIKKGGAWFTLPDGNKIQGRDALKQLFKDNEDFYHEIESQVLNKLHGQ